VIYRGSSLHRFVRREAQFFTSENGKAGIML